MVTAAINNKMITLVFFILTYFIIDY